MRLAFTEFFPKRIHKLSSGNSTVKVADMVATPDIMKARIYKSKKKLAVSSASKTRPSTTAAGTTFNTRTRNTYDKDSSIASLSKPAHSIINSSSKRAPK